MVEKWMRGNKPVKFKNSAYYGSPSKLFKDSDRDGVMNVFDCKPYNRRKQDVISPPSSSTPFNDMWGRQEWARQQKLARDQEQARLNELKRLSNVTSNTEVTQIHHWYPGAKSSSSDSLDSGTGSSETDSSTVVIRTVPARKVPAPTPRTFPTPTPKPAEPLTIKVAKVILKRFKLI